MIDLLPEGLDLNVHDRYRVFSRTGLEGMLLMSALTQVYPLRAMLLVLDECREMGKKCAGICQVRCPLRSGNSLIIDGTM